MTAWAEYRTLRNGSSRGHISYMATGTSAPRPTAAQRQLAKRMADGEAILLYDGVCGLCDRFVQFVLRHDRHGTLKFATLQGPYGEGARSSLPGLADVDSLILVTPSGAYVRSAAALEVVRYLGGMWAALLVFYAVPRVLRDWVYDQVAKRRYRMFGRYDTCRIPEPATRARFLDS